MQASELYEAGKLTEAIDAQIAVVKSKPADHSARLFLFELLALAGELDRARRQIDAIQYEEIERESALQGYRQLLDAEEARRRLFRDGLEPNFFVDPPDHVRRRLDAVARLRENNQQEASGCLAEAAESATSVNGQLNGKPVSNLRDCDDLLGTVLEVMARGNYYWVPLEQIESVTMNQPKYPRDLLWIPVRIDIADGATGEAYLPAIYPGSYENADDEIKMGRKTDWTQQGEGPVMGQGAKMFLAGDDSLALIQWRELVVDPVDADA